MSRISEALDRYEAAARSAGLRLGHASPCVLEPGEPITKAALEELERLGAKLPDEYVEYLHRWNGMSVIDGVIDGVETRDVSFVGYLHSLGDTLE